MNILFLGLGSIGRRHARLLRAHFPEHRLFALRSGNGLPHVKESAGDLEALGIEEIDRKAAARLSGGVAFITNPTCMHIGTALDCARMGLHLFLEKPIGCDRQGLDELTRALTDGKLASYVAYNLRFHPLIEHIKAHIAGWQVESAEVDCLSWLPDWRPGTDHLKSYSASAASGGGVLLDLSHELDYVDWLFGGVRSLAGEFGRRSGVTLDAEDYADLRVGTGAGPAVRVRLDIGSRIRKRGIRLSLRGGGHLHADLLDSTLSGTALQEAMSFPCERDTPYERQLRYFLSHLGSGPMNSLHEALPLFGKILDFKEAA